MGLSERGRLAEEYALAEAAIDYGIDYHDSERVADHFRAGASWEAQRSAALVEALEKYAEFDGEYKWISLTAREALAKYRGK